MIIRFSKILCVAAVAFYCLLAVFVNISDYYIYFPAVERALMMKDIAPSVSYRAINNPILHHIAYITIITFETITAILCTIGALTLFRARASNASSFNHAKKWAVAGLTLGFLTWQVLFMSIGGEWFGIWMSPMLKGVPAAAFQIFITVLVVLLYVVAKDE